MDLGEKSILEQFIKQLAKRFHSSNRMERLKGMKLESEGKFTEALDVYWIDAIGS